MLLLIVSLNSYCQISFSKEDSSLVKTLKLNGRVHNYFLFGENDKLKNGELFSGKDSTTVINNEDTFHIHLWYTEGIKVKAIGYFTNGVKYRETFFNKFGNDGSDIRWHKNGQKEFHTSYKDNISISPSISWYEDGELESISDFNSKTNKGVIREWNEKGVLIEETKSIDTTDAGLLITSFFDSGKLKTQSVFNNGKQSYAAYYEDGSSLFVKGNILNAYWNKVGVWTEYFANGTIKSVISYLDADDINRANIKDGISKIWNKQGDLIKEEVYENGELIDTKEYLPLNKKLD